MSIDTDGLCGEVSRNGIQTCTHGGAHAGGHSWEGRDGAFRLGSVCAGPTIAKDLGHTPGNDRALLLSCGHTVLVDDPEAPRAVGEEQGCYYCDKETK